MKRTAIGPWMLVATFLVSAESAHAQGDAARGAALAAEHCAACHDVSADGVHKEYPPSFASIAVYRSRAQIEGRMLYPPQHASMPQLAFIMLPGEIDDLVATRFRSALVQEGVLKNAQTSWRSLPEPISSLCRQGGRRKPTPA